MNERTTQTLLAAIVVLLAAHLVRLQLLPVAQAQEIADVIRAREIQLVDAQGQVVGQLHIGVDGGGNLRLRAGDGTVRVKLAGTDDGSGLLLMDRDSNPAFSLASGDEGTSLTLAERGRRSRVIRPRRRL